MSKASETRRDFIADHVRTIPRSGIRDFFDIVQSMDNVISLGVGEPGFITPWHIREAGIYALERGRTSYTSNYGLLKLRRAIARYLANDYGLQYDPNSEVLVTVGVSEAMDIALRALLNPGDEVLYHEPCYVSYHPSIGLCQGIPRPISTRPKQQFSLTADDVRSALTDRTKVLILSFPTNPTGATLGPVEVERIAKLCVEHDLVVITDEIYSELTYGDTPHASIAAEPGMKERTIFLHGFSKAFAMTGFRIGYACAPPDLLEGMLRVHQYAMMCAPIVSQDAAIEALEHGAEDIVRMRDHYRMRRNFIVKSFNEMGLTCHLPDGAFYAFPSIAKTGLNAREFSVRLLEQERVAMVPGTAFGPGGEGFVRASYCAPMEDLEQAVERIGRFLKGL